MMRPAKPRRVWGTILVGAALGVGLVMAAPLSTEAQEASQGACRVEAAASGWIDLECGLASVMVQSGPALSGSTARQFAYASDRIRAEIGGGVSGEDVRAQIAGASHDAIAFVVRADKTSFLGYPMLDPKGEVRHRGLSALIATPTHGRVRASCVMEAANFEASRCEAILGALKERGIAAPATSAGDGVRVGGQRLNLSSDCDVASSGRVVCDGGELGWLEGERTGTAQAHREAIEALTKYNGQGGVHNPHTEHACTLLGEPATCHAVGWNGVTNTASYWLYSAHLDRGAQSVHLSCWFNAEKAMPTPCRDFFAETHRSAGR